MELQKANSTRTKCLTTLAVMILCAVNSGWMITAFPINDAEQFTSIAPHLQSMAMAILSTAAILYFITRIINFRTAVMAALTWSTTFAFIRFSRSAQPAMTTTSLITIAALSFCSAGTEKNKIRRAILYLLTFAITLSLAHFAKGIPQSTAAEKPFYFYLPVLLVAILPWIAILPMALIAPLQKAWQQKRTLMILLFLWFAFAIVYASASQFKAPHLLLPAIPPVAILIGIVLEDLIFTQHVYTKKIAALFFQYHIMVVLFGSIAAAAYASGKTPRMLPQFIVIMVITLTLAAATVLLFMKNLRIAATALIFTAITLLSMIAITLYAP